MIAVHFSEQFANSVIEAFNTGKPIAPPSGQWTGNEMLTLAGMLPAWFHPRDGRSPLSLHSNPSRWSRHGQHVHLQTVGRGQEVVLAAGEYPEAVPWARNLIKDHGGSA